jgi:hypothetical protein
MFLGSGFPVPAFLAALLSAQFPFLIFIASSISVANDLNTVIISTPLSSFSNGTPIPSTTRIPSVPLTI